MASLPNISPGPSDGPAPRSDSPCISVCVLDDASGHCKGCGRTMDEIAGWRSLSADERGRVWQALPGRLAALGQTTGRLAWGMPELRRFVEERLAPGTGTWVLGCYGALAEVTIDPGEPMTRQVDGDRFVMATARARLSLTLGPRVHAYAFAAGAALDDHGSGMERQVILARLRPRQRMPAATGLTSLGHDTGALAPAARAHRLYDLGLGRPHVSFCVRTGDPALIDVLDAALGTPWPALLGAIGPALVAASPDRVVTTPLGRAEVMTPIPPPGGRSPDGPHTHLLPDHLALGRDLPPGHDLPEACQLGAIFYPRA